MARLDDMRILEEWEDHWLDPDSDWTMEPDWDEDREDIDWYEVFDDDRLEANQ